jgi:hypothetical protein
MKSSFLGLFKSFWWNLQIFEGDWKVDSILDVYLYSDFVDEQGVVLDVVKLEF